MNTQEMHEVGVETEAGRMTFPQVVHRLLEIGVESYLVDFVAGRKTYYLKDGSAHTEPITITVDSVAGEFSSSALVAAIRGTKADRIRYPEFVKQSTAAGVLAYWAFLTGERVVYFGRKGQSHIEDFPTAKPVQ